MIVPYLYWLASVIISVWVYIVGLSNLIFNFPCEMNTLQAEYDYVVVGAGTAGSIVASRLAEGSNVTVLLIEAGRSCSSWILDIPILSPLLQLSDIDWQFKTVAQKDACFGLENNSSRWPRGKVVGGSSHLNYLMYVRGHRKDFDKWDEEENLGWHFSDDILHYFKRTEKQNGKYQNDPFHSTWGPIIVDDIHHKTPLADAFMTAGFELGYHTRDLNSEHQSGFMTSQVHVNKGQRWNIDYGYLNINHHNQLIVFCDTIVDKILFENNFEAVGVEVIHAEEKFTIRAKRAVILSAGTIGSSTILMRSGVGPKTHLKEMKIPVVRDLNVGQNLQDHITTGLDLIILNQSLSLGLSDILSVSSFMKYIFSGKGPWSSTGCEAFGIIHSNGVDEREYAPDLQIMALPMGLSSDHGTHMRKAMGVKQEVWDEYFSPLKGQYVASIMPVLLHPKSRGDIKLQSIDPKDPPIINPNYLSSSDDIKILYEGIKIVKKLINTQAMQKLGAQLYSKKIPGCEHHEFDSEKYWSCYIKHLTLTSYHPVGTCKMGPRSDGSAVVDDHLRVHGTNKLFVIDASVMPTLPSGNINAAVMMIAEKGADLVKEVWQHTIKKSPANSFFIHNLCIGI